MNCCRPVQRGWSRAGLSWYHDRDCPESPSKFIRYAASDVANQRRTEQQTRETQDSGVVVQLRRRGAVHPACSAAHADGGTPCMACAPRLHRASCQCAACSYFDANSDGAV